MRRTVYLPTDADSIPDDFGPDARPLHRRLMLIDCTALP
jgi:hypothetical protein